MRKKDINLKHLAVYSVKWTSISVFAVTLINMVQLFFLGKMLKASEFGLSAMCLLVIDFAGKFTSSSLSQSMPVEIDDSKSVSDKGYLSSVFWLNVITGTFIFLILFATAPWIALFFDEPRIANLISISAVAIPVSSFGVQFQSILRRNFRFNILSKIEIISAFSAMTVSVASAYAGAGVYSFIWGQLAGVASDVFFCVVSGLKFWTPSLRFCKADFKDYIHVGLYKAGEQILNFFGGSMDRFLIGILASPTMLGYYMFAHKISVSYISKLNNIFIRAISPVLRKTKHNTDTDRFKNTYLKMLDILLVIKVPILLGLVAVSPQLMVLAFDRKWAASVSLVQILALVELFRSFRYADEILLFTKEHAGRSFKWQLILLICQASAIFFGFQLGGITGIAAAYAVLYFIYIILGYRFVVRLIFGDCLEEYINRLRPAISAGVLMSVSVWIAGSILSFVFQDFPLNFRRCLLIFEAICGAAIYISFIYRYKKDIFVELKALILSYLFQKENEPDKQYANM